ncbi:MAG: (2Fe-2S)-binding protein [Caldilinea sp.]|nr:(2Fe-2S)-binding protein [Caldilinea sp.]MDW8442698.1 ferric iron reductase [Caldilineaceae bacterium]
MTQSLVEHPLRRTFARIGHMHRYIQVRLGETDEVGWIAPIDLFTPGAVALQKMIDAAQKRLRTEAANIIAGALLQEYQWPLIASAIAGFLIDRRVPDMSLQNVRLRLPSQESKTQEVHESIAYCCGRFAALPDDPAADHPDAWIVPDPDALRAYLRAGIEAHMGWVIGRLSQYLGCSERGLWPYVTDRCGGMLCWLMQQQQRTAASEDIEEEFQALLKVSGSPLNNKKAGLFALTYRDCTRVFLNRATCCFWYKTEGGDYCANCPHRTQTDRHQRLLQSIVLEYEKRA